MIKQAAVTVNGKRMTQKGSLDGAARTVAFVYHAMLALMLAAGAAAAWSTWEGWRSHAFVETQGTITEITTSRVDRNTPAPGKPMSRTRYLHVRYDYEIAGTVREGTRIEAGTYGLVRGDDVRRFGPLFEVGDTVAVFVDPADHANSVLVRGVSGIATFLWAITGFFTLATLFLRVFHVAFRAEVQSRRKPVFGRQPRR